MTDFILLGSKITGDGDCSHEIQRSSLLGRKTMTNLDSVLKNTDITFLNLFFNWRIVALQNFVVVCQTSTWISHAAAAKLLQSCPTLRPHRRQPTRLSRPWDSPGKNTGVGCHFPDLTIILIPRSWKKFKCEPKPIQYCKGKKTSALPSTHKELVGKCS